MQISSHAVYSAICESSVRGHRFHIFTRAGVVTLQAEWNIVHCASHEESACDCRDSDSCRWELWWGRNLAETDCKPSRIQYWRILESEVRDEKPYLARALQFWKEMTRVLMVQHPPKIFWDTLIKSQMQCPDKAGNPTNGVLQALHQIQHGWAVRSSKRS